MNKKWEVFWEDSAEKDLSKIDKTTARKIRDKVKNHLADNPTKHGKLLKYQWEGFWRYPVDDHRIIYEIIYKVKKQEKEITILVVTVGERKRWQLDDVYERKPPRPLSKDRTITERSLRNLKRKVGKK